MRTFNLFAKVSTPKVLHFSCLKPHETISFNPINTPSFCLTKNVIWTPMQCFLGCYGCQMDVKIALCAYWERTFFLLHQYCLLIIKDKYNIKYNKSFIKDKLIHFILKIFKNFPRSRHVSSQIK